MDRDRFETKAACLRAGAKLLADLARMPDRATAKDFQGAADLMASAADDFDNLRKSRPIGCVCRRIESDNYSCLDYEPTCTHHGHLFALAAKLKADYEKLERALKNEVRLRLITSALAGTAALAAGGEAVTKTYAERALDLADAALHQISGEGVNS